LQRGANYEQWIALARELALPVSFAVGAGDVDFRSLIAASHALVTTSIAEGFGLAFLEPWLLDRPLVGRDLPEITADFRDAGVHLPDLYQRLEVPLTWLDARRLRAAFRAAAERRAVAYAQPPADSAERAWESAVHDDSIDLAWLDEPAQEQVIRRLSADRDTRTALRPRALNVDDAATSIAANRIVIAREYSVAGFGDRLAGVYAKVAAAMPSASFDAARGDRLLQDFPAPERLCLLRS
jgi:hypothetical protein